MVASCEDIPSFVFHESRVTQLLCVHERARRRSDAVTLFWACSRGGWVAAVQSGCTHQDRARSGTTKGTDENGGLGRTDPVRSGSRVQAIVALVWTFLSTKMGTWTMTSQRAPECVCVPRRQSGEKSGGKWPTLPAASISIARLGLFKVHIRHRSRCQWTLQQFHFPLQGLLLWQSASYQKKTTTKRTN